MLPLLLADVDLAGEDGLVVGALAAAVVLLGKVHHRVVDQPLHADAFHRLPLDEAQQKDLLLLLVLGWVAQELDVQGFGGALFNI